MYFLGQNVDYVKHLGGTIVSSINYHLQFWCQIVFNINPTLSIAMVVLI